MKIKFLTFGLVAVFTLTSLAQSKQKTTTTSSNSVTVSNSNKSYRFRVSFDKSKTDDVKKILLAKLSNEDLEIGENAHLWVKNINGDVVFKCKLTKDKVKIYLDKNEVSTSYYNKIHALGNELKTLIYGTNSKEYYLNAIKTAKRELEIAKRTLNRSKKELEIARRTLNRSKRELEKAKIKIN